MNRSLRKILCATLVLGCACGAAKAGTVSVANTFEDSAMTGGSQASFATSGPETIDGGDEFTNFAGLYDIDVSSSSIVMELVDNSGVTDMVIPAGRYDRYYFEFESTVDEAALAGGASLNADANLVILDPGTKVHMVDTFSTGIETPLVFSNGGILVELTEGTDLSTLGSTVVVNYQLDGASSGGAVTPEPTAGLLVLMGLTGMLTLRRRR